MSRPYHERYIPSDPFSLKQEEAFAENANISVDERRRRLQEQHRIIAQKVHDILLPYRGYVQQLIATPGFLRGDGDTEIVFDGEEIDGMRHSSSTLLLAMIAYHDTWYRQPEIQLVPEQLLSTDDLFQLSTLLSLQKDAPYEYQSLLPEGRFQQKLDNYIALAGKIAEQARQLAASNSGDSVNERAELLQRQAELREEKHRQAVSEWQERRHKHIRQIMLNSWTIGPDEDENTLQSPQPGWVVDYIMDNEISCSLHIQETLSVAKFIKAWFPPELCIDSNPENNPGPDLDELMQKADQLVEHATQKTEGDGVGGQIIPAQENAAGLANTSPADAKDAEQAIGTGMRWQDAQEGLKTIRTSGEPFRGQRYYANRLYCSQGTIRKAINNDAGLKAWQAESRPDAKKAQQQRYSTEAASLTEQSTEPQPDQETELLQVVESQFLDDAKPEQKAQYHAMSDDEKRNFLAEYADRRD